MLRMKLYAKETGQLHQNVVFRILHLLMQSAI